MIDLPKEWKNNDWVKFLKLKAVFDPWEQPKNVKVKVGKNGEKLSGPKVKVEKGKKNNDLDKKRDILNELFHRGDNR
jgi:hypothetical protein